MNHPEWTSTQWWLERQGASTNPIRLIGVPICPDLLDHATLGGADNLRGRVIRGFFWLMRAWPT